MKLSRRQYLAGLGTAGLAGCIDRFGSGDETPNAPELDAVETQGSPGGTVVARPAGEAALVDFFATWCAPCKPQMAELRTVTEEFPDLHMVSVTQETDRGEIQSFWQDYDGNWPVATDPQLQAFQAYDVDGVPTKVLVTSDGEVAWRHKGLASADTINSEIEKIR